MGHHSQSNFCIVKIIHIQDNGKESSIEGSITKEIIAKVTQEIIAKEEPKDGKSSKGEEANSSCVHQEIQTVGGFVCYYWNERSISIRNRQGIVGIFEEE